MNKHIFDLEFFMFKKLALGVALLSVCSLAQATNTYNLGSSRVVGSEQVYTLDPNGTTTLEYVAAEYHLGLSNMIEASALRGLSHHASAAVSVPAAEGDRKCPALPADAAISSAEEGVLLHCPGEPDSSLSPGRYLPLRSVHMLFPGAVRISIHFSAIVSVFC